MLGESPRPGRYVREGCVDVLLHRYGLARIPAAAVRGWRDAREGQLLELEAS